MLSLYNTLLAQHPRQLTPVRCAEQTIAQLHRYFEDVVVENNLAALVVEGTPPVEERSLRELARVREVARAARHAFFFVSPEDALSNITTDWDESGRDPVMIKLSGQSEAEERFVVIADARFSALLASVRSPGGDALDAAGDEVVWTFEPDIVYSALEYLMARVTAERPKQASLFAAAVRKCVPKATSLQLTVSVTTKLARMLQEQAVREIAVNRIATAIRSSLELPSVLQTTVDEVGRALGAQHSALCVEGERGGPPLFHCYFRDYSDDESDRDALASDLDAYRVRLGARMKVYVQDGCAGDGADASTATLPVAAVPLIYRERNVGVLMARSDDPARLWQENEILLMRTVADQVAVAVNHARLFAEMQLQALTDSLTGCPNRRSFEMQLERDLHMAARLRHPLSLIMLDVDNFKRVNDTHGHDAGDVALRMIADCLRQELRGVDTAARYGGEEFAVILPQAGIDGALSVAERLRMRVERLEVPRVGHVTASLGVATFPIHAGTRDLLVTNADRALYEAKRLGRNRIRVAADESVEAAEEEIDATAEAEGDAFDVAAGTAGVTVEAATNKVADMAAGDEPEGTHAGPDESAETDFHPQDAAEVLVPSDQTVA